MNVDHSMIDLDEGNALGIDFNFAVEDIPMLDADLAAPLSPAVCQSDAGTQQLNQTPKKRKVRTYLYMNFFIKKYPPDSRQRLANILVLLTYLMFH